MKKHCLWTGPHTWEGEAQLILMIIVEVQQADLRRFNKHKKRAALWTLKIFVEAQGADLWRFDKHKKRATLGAGEYPPEMNCPLFCCTQGIEVWMGPSYAQFQNSYTGSSLI